jgi:hypothetical protein
MIIINSADITTFKINGISYLKNYVTRVVDNKIEIFNCYDRKDILVPLNNYSNFIVNGSTFNNAVTLQEALIDLLYYRSTLSEDSILYPDATPLQKGILKLNGDLSGTADLPTVPALGNKVDKETGKGLSANDFSDSYKSKLDNLQNYFIGVYPTVSELEATFPLGLPGQYATIDSGEGIDAKRAIWDTTDNKWVTTASSGDVLSVNGQTGEVLLNTDSIGEGTNNKYFSMPRVLSSLLTGLTTLAGDILSTDTLIEGLGKIKNILNLKLNSPASPSKLSAVTLNSEGLPETMELKEFIIFDNTVTPYNSISELITIGGYSQDNGYIRGTEIRCGMLNPKKIYYKYDNTDVSWFTIEGIDLPLE